MRIEGQKSVYKTFDLQWFLRTIFLYLYNRIDHNRQKNECQIHA
jgi:hypothetical protein